MEKKRTRFALIGVLSLALCLTVGLLGGAAEAKKGKSKGARTFTVAKTTPTAVPLANAVTGQSGVVKVPIGTVGGKRLKGKVISFNGITVTTSSSGGAGYGQNMFVNVAAPNGRGSGLNAPAFDEVVTAQGPTIESANSQGGFCVPDYAPAVPPPPPCTDPDVTLGPPYAGTIQNGGLATFGGISPNGSWIVKVFNGSTTVPVTLNSISVTGGLINALPNS